MLRHCTKRYSHHHIYASSLFPKTWNGIVPTFRKQHRTRKDERYGSINNPECPIRSSTSLTFNSPSKLNEPLNKNDCFELSPHNFSIVKKFDQQNQQRPYSETKSLSLLSPPPPPSSSAATATTHLSTLEDDENDYDNDNQKVEDIYTRKTPIEHVLSRPGMYVGPTSPTLSSSSRWIVQEDDDGNSSKSKIRMVRVRDDSVVTTHPALGKIFDEILVNATDNRLRNPESCTKIEVWIDRGCTGGDDGEERREARISVLNNGKGIPVQVHPKENIYVPEMLFGHLLTGSNFDDEGKRVTGGRHGFGAKLTNIFSKSFTVETFDSKRGLLYRQTWENNMSISHPPQITTATKDGGDYTCISFIPDLPKLTGNPNATVISQDDYDYMKSRVVDAAGCSFTSSKRSSTGQTKFITSLNNQPIPLSGFKQYAQAYQPSTNTNKEAPHPILFHQLNPRWQIAITISPTQSFESVSFVNGMSTPQGGTHVDIILQQIIKLIADQVIKIHPELQDAFKSTKWVKRHLMIFLNTLIENPTFNSQMKECLTSNPSDFGSPFKITDGFVKDLFQSEEDGGPGIIEEITLSAQNRLHSALLRTLTPLHNNKRSSNKRHILSIPKLDDAHHAGTTPQQSQSCTLILTEGDSAKALAVSGLEILGRDKFGIYPLRGKFLNVRDANVSKLERNEEVKALCKILGLDFEKEYGTMEERMDGGLRYGSVMLMTDQDADGSHIKGLVMNFFRFFWPKLLMPPTDATEDEEMKPFLSCFVTPLLKATLKKSKHKKKSETISFFSMSEYDQWRKSLQETQGEDEIRKKWDVKYYKGLGTSTPAEAKEYFSAFEDHHRVYQWNDDEDGALLDMVFEKDRASDRRDWINSGLTALTTAADHEDIDEEGEMDKDDNSVSYSKFVNEEMIQFSNADNIRSLPSVVDGLKPSQRKVLFACFKRNLKKEIKVAQLTGYCAEHTAYHHGEASLHATITAMAQDFVGSNNINLLVPSGQFGTRLAGGKDAASPRYIFTNLSPISRLLFPEVDDALLQYKEDDGQSIEPEFFCPVIPLLLVNGSQGIGTGWSTFIPPHNPKDVLNYIRAKLDDIHPLPTINPYVKGFKGEITIKNDDNDEKTGYITSGLAKKTSKTSLLIHELPVGRWTNDYKTHLLKMRDKAEIQSFVEDHTTTSVQFRIRLKAVQLNRMIQTKGLLERTFKLNSSLPLTNMNAFDEQGVIRLFDSPEEVVESYFPIRLGLYGERKVAMEGSMRYLAAVLEGKARFIDAVSRGDVDLVRGRKTKDEVIGLMRELGFRKYSELESLKESGTSESATENDGLKKEFDYLLNMPLASLTKEKMSALREEAAKKKMELETLQGTSPEDLWRADLDKLEPHL